MPTILATPQIGQIFYRINNYYKNCYNTEFFKLITIDKKNFVLRRINHMEHTPIGKAEKNITLILPKINEIMYYEDIIDCQLRTENVLVGKIDGQIEQFYLTRNDSIHKCKYPN